VFNVIYTDVDIKLFDILEWVIALAVYNQMLMPSRFPRLMYRKMLRLPIELSHLRKIDEKLVAGLRQVFTSLKDLQVFEKLDLISSVIVERFGQGVIVPLALTTCGVSAG
jgi:putative copper export protein